MSSFVIDKKEYMKAAGLMYGIENAKQHTHRYFLDNVRAKFVRCYELNVASVNEQYGVNDAPDELSYDYIFKRYSTLGDRIKNGLVEGTSYQWLRRRLMRFFSSVLYQIENEEMSKEVAAFFHECTVKLFDEELYAIEGWWGNIEL